MTPPLHKSVDDQYTTGEEQRKSYKKNEEADQNGNSQLWFHLVVKVKSEAIKNNIARNLEC